jgi:hypothetical protein
VKLELFLFIYLEPELEVVHKIKEQPPKRQVQTPNPFSPCTLGQGHFDLMCSTLDLQLTQMFPKNKSPRDMGTNK